jgi:hypothetical protein
MKLKMTKQEFILALFTIPSFLFNASHISHIFHISPQVTIYRTSTLGLLVYCSYLHAKVIERKKEPFQQLESIFVKNVLKIAFL